MSDTGFRPKTYEMALAYFNERRNKNVDYRAVIHGVPMDEPKGTPSRILEKITAHYEADSDLPVLAYQQHQTNIATFFPDGRIHVVGWDSNVSRRRMEEMRLPYYQALSSRYKGRRYELPKFSGCRLWGVKGYPLGLPGDRVTARRRHSPQEGVTLDLVGTEPTEPVAIPKIDQLRAFNRSRRAMLKVIGSWSRMTMAMLDGDPSYHLNDFTGTRSKLLCQLRHGDNTVAAWQEWLTNARMMPYECEALLDMAAKLTFWNAIPWGDDQYYDKVTVPSSRLKEVLDAVQLR